MKQNQKDEPIFHKESFQMLNERNLKPNLEDATNKSITKIRVSLLYNYLPTE